MDLLYDISTPENPTEEDLKNDVFYQMALDAWVNDFIPTMLYYELHPFIVAVTIKSYRRAYLAINLDATI